MSENKKELNEEELETVSGGDVGLCPEGLTAVNSTTCQGCPYLDSENLHIQTTGITLYHFTCRNGYGEFDEEADEERR